MGSNYKKLGGFIRTVDERNSGLAITNLQGVSITKEFVPSIANIIGTDLSTYKIVRTGQFAYGPVTSRNGDKISIALLKGDDCIVSSTYVPFEVYKTKELLPEYLMLWFMRPEFDRYARFMSNGSAREVFDWDCMRDVEIPIPPISEQHKIVHTYQVVTNRIVILQKINENLLLFIRTLFDKKIRRGLKSSEYREVPLGNVLSLIIDHRGKTPKKMNANWSEEGILAISAKNIKNDQLVNLNVCNKVDETLFNRWMTDKLEPKDILMTSEAPLGEFFYLANFCEYCLSQRVFALRANKKIIEPTVLYFQLTDNTGKNLIDSRKTGTTVTGIRQSELVKVPVIVPIESIQKEFSTIADPIMQLIEENAEENKRLSVLRDTLLPRIMSGELDVSKLDL